MDPVTLFQFELCPFCHKVKAGLEVKRVPYRTVEVNPMNKKELPALPPEAPRKVPVLQKGDEVVYDSSTILEWMDGAFGTDPRLVPEDDALADKTRAIERWVDDELSMALPTVIYGTWGEALKAAQVTARTSNFGFLQNMGVRAGGPLIMHQVSKRILKKRGRSDGHAWITEVLDHFEAELGDQPFVAGDSISLGDVATHGALSCVAEFPISQKIMDRSKIASWFGRVSELRDGDVRLS